MNNVDPTPTAFVPETSRDKVTPVPVSVVEPIPLLETPVIPRLEYDGADIDISGFI